MPTFPQETAGDYSVSTNQNHHQTRTDTIGRPSASRDANRDSRSIRSNRLAHARRQRPPAIRTVSSCPTSVNSARSCLHNLIKPSSKRTSLNHESGLRTAPAFSDRSIPHRRPGCTITGDDQLTWRVRCWFQAPVMLWEPISSYLGGAQDDHESRRTSGSSNSYGWAGVPTSG